MKIDVIIPSRGNPTRLMAVLTCFDQLSTGNHEVTYRIICDMDDPLTCKAAESLKLNTAIHIGTGNLQTRMNDAAKEGDAQIVTTAADDVFPLAQDWDGILAVADAKNIPAFSWQEVRDPTNHTNLVFSRKWLKAVGRMLSEYFPFWFGDTWVAEVFEMAFTQPMPIISNLPWGGRRGKTRGMRDLAFWFEFFAATRIERVAEARALCFAYERKFEVPEAMAADMKRRDAEQLTRVPQYEQWFGANQGDPSEQYVKMKTAADQWLVQRR